MKKKTDQPFRHPSRRSTKDKINNLKNPDLIFNDLAVRLEKRIGNIESDLKKAILDMEEDLRLSIKSQKFIDEEKIIKEELELLSRQIDIRIKKSIDDLFENKKHHKKDKDELLFVKSLSDQLSKFLSIDFIKKLFDQISYSALYGEVDDFGMDAKFIEKIKPFFDFLYFKYWRISTTGIENIPDDGKALIVANHSGTVPYDGSMIKTAILNEHPVRKDARFLVENFVYYMPMMGTFMYRIGGVRACPENAELLLKTDHLVIVFPEGVKGIGKYYNDRYKLQRMGRGGFIKLCMKTKSPLIPTAIVGAEEIHPIIFKSNTLAKAMGLPYIPITPTFPLMGLLGLIPLPTKWSIQFGKPIEFKNYQEKDLQNDLLIHKLSEEVRDRIQTMLNLQLENRRSIWY